jgi:ArsR family transcriptional regulator, arsenate/arsenite/antimonite-responsive transcriptional repressor
VASRGGERTVQVQDGYPSTFVDAFTLSHPSIDVNMCDTMELMKSLPLLRPASAGTCCAPLAAAPLSEDEAGQLAVQLKAVADPARLRLLSLILASPDDEACVCDLTEPVGLSQPTVSHHMKVLADAGLVRREKRGRWAYYRAVPEALGALSRILQPRS